MMGFWVMRLCLRIVRRLWVWCLDVGVRMLLIGSVCLVWVLWILSCCVWIGMICGVMFWGIFSCWRWRLWMWWFSIWSGLMCVMVGVLCFCVL